MRTNEIEEQKYDVYSQKPAFNQIILYKKVPIFAKLAMSQRWSAIFCATGVWGVNRSGVWGLRALSIWHQNILIFLYVLGIAKNLDKASVIRITISFLRMCKFCENGPKDWNLPFQPLLKARVKQLSSSHLVIYSLQAIIFIKIFLTPHLTFWYLRN